MEEKILYNFIKIKSFSLFFDKYCYIDTPTYLIDNILIDKKIMAKFLPIEFENPDHPHYRFCMVKVPKSKRYIMEEEVFTELNKKIYSLYGQEYTDFIVKLYDAIDEFKFKKGDNNENSSR